MEIDNSIIELNGKRYMAEPVNIVVRESLQHRFKNEMYLGDLTLINPKQKESQDMIKKGEWETQIRYGIGKYGKIGLQKCKYTIIGDLLFGEMDLGQIEVYPSGGTLNLSLPFEVEDNAVSLATIVAVVNREKNGQHTHYAEDIVLRSYENQLRFKKKDTNDFNNVTFLPTASAITLSFCVRIKKKKIWQKQTIRVEFDGSRSKEVDFENRTELKNLLFHNLFIDNEEDIFVFSGLRIREI